MATIKEIAELAGVSRGTVDRVLNGRGAVSEQTERKVLEIAQALQYRPNRAGIVLAVWYAFGGNAHLMLRSIFLLIVMPFGILYVLLLLYNILAMTASHEAFTVLSPGEKTATLLISPFYLLEYIPIYIVGFYRLKHKARLTWEASERQRYDNAAEHAGEITRDEDAPSDK